MEEKIRPNTYSHVILILYEYARFYMLERINEFII